MLFNIFRHVMKGEVKKEMEMFTNRIKLFCSVKKEANMKILAEGSCKMVQLDIGVMWN